MFTLISKLFTTIFWVRLVLLTNISTAREQVLILNMYLFIEWEGRTAKYVALIMIMNYWSSATLLSQ